MNWKIISCQISGTTLQTCGGIDELHRHCNRYKILTSCGNKTVDTGGGMYTRAMRPSALQLNKESLNCFLTHCRGRPLSRIEHSLISSR